MVTCRGVVKSDGREAVRAHLNGEPAPRMTKRTNTAANSLEVRTRRKISRRWFRCFRHTSRGVDEMIHRREASGFEKEIRGEDPGNTLRLASHRSMACLTDACKVPRCGRLL